MVKKIFLLAISFAFLITGCSTNKSPIENTTIPSPTISIDNVSSTEIPVLENNDFLAMFPEITYTAKMIDGRIPILESYLDNGQLNKPLVIMVHGANGNKEAMGYLQGLFSQNGFYVISLDLRSHGEREIEKVTFHDVLISTGEDIDKVIEYALTSEQIDAENFGMLGFSMGGMICYWYTANGKYTPKIIAPIASTPDWSQIQDSYLVNLLFENGNSEIVTDNHQQEVEKMLASSPINNLDKFMNTTIIIGHGGLDDLIYPIGAQTFYQTMLSMNHPKIEYHEYPDVQHHTPNDFIPIMVNTFTNALNPKP